MTNPISRREMIQTSTLAAGGLWLWGSRLRAEQTTAADWGGSHWIGRDETLENTYVPPRGSHQVPPEPNFYPAPYLRTTFDTHEPIRSALLYVSALGFGEVYLNGEKVGDSVRDPGFTNYDRRVLFVRHDVTKLLNKGKNAVGAILGTGWYDVHDAATWRFNEASWRRRPRMLLTIVLTYKDGTQQFVVSDDKWRTSAGPLLRDGIYTGEVYDARKEMPGWSTAEFDDRAWTPALQVEAPKGQLAWRTCEPVRVCETIVPVAITEPKPGTFVVDMGQNFAGHAQLKVKGPAGQAITMRYSEILYPDGTVDTETIDLFMTVTDPKQPFQEDTYICKGGGDWEVWEPRFTWKGFQYVQVTGLPGRPTIDNFRGRFTHTDFALAGEFTCSDDLVNRIHQATVRSYLSNAQGYPSDCPQREKNGWTGDAAIAADTGLMNFQAAGMYRKWLDDLADAQLPNGGIPVIVPTPGWGTARYGPVCPPWDFAYIGIVWQVYRATGDKQVLTDHVDRLRKYVEFFLGVRGPNALAPESGLGDILNWKTDTPQDFITNAYLYIDLVILSKIYAALDQSSLADHYGQLATATAQAIHTAYYSPATHRYAGGSPTAQGMALQFGFVPDSEHAAVLADLVAQVEAAGYLDVGILGMRFTTHALAQGGRADLVYRACCARLEPPGYGFWVKTHNSTTLWESWDATQLRGGDMSHNHIIFGDISAWFYHWIAGIQQEPDSVAFERIVFRPNRVGEMTQASAYHLTPRGKVASAWNIHDQHVDLELTVPDGAMARLVLPSDWRFSNGQATTEQSLGGGVHRITATMVNG